MKYRKKPVVIEAFRLGIDCIPDWFMDKVTSNEVILHGTSSGFEHHDDTNADIKTLEGVMHANFGDFIIEGIKGEIYPCKPDIFEATYESVDTTSNVAPIADTVKKIIARLSDRDEFEWHADIDTRTLSHSDLIEWVTEIAAELLENAKKCD